MQHAGKVALTHAMLHDKKNVTCVIIGDVIIKKSTEQSK